MEELKKRLEENKGAELNGSMDSWAWAEGEMAAMATALLRVLALHKPIPIGHMTDGSQECELCTMLCPSYSREFWPCPTVEAIQKAMGAK